MEEDNVYPLDGSHFLAEPPEQTIERKKEKANTLQALPILQDLLKRLKKRITFYESVLNIDDSVRADPQAFLIAHNSNMMTVKALHSEKEYIETLMENAMPKRR